MKLFQNKMTALRNVVVAATMIVATTTTFAHVSLVSAIPAENASILSQPKNLTLNFGAEVMLMNIKLLDAQRRDVPLKYKVTHDLKKSFDVALPKLKKVNIPLSGQQLKKVNIPLSGQQWGKMVTT